MSSSAGLAVALAKGRATPLAVHPRIARPWSGTLGLVENRDLTERLITASEFAAILRVTEDDVLRWMLAGRISYLDGPDGEPQVRIREHHSVEGPVSSGMVTYWIDRAPDFQAELARRRRELELAASDCGDVDLHAPR